MKNLKKRQRKMAKYVERKLEVTGNALRLGHDGPEGEQLGSRGEGP